MSTRKPYQSVLALAVTGDPATATDPVKAQEIYEQDSIARRAAAEQVMQVLREGRIKSWGTPVGGRGEGNVEAGSMAPREWERRRIGELESERGVPVAALAQRQIRRYPLPARYYRNLLFDWEDALREFAKEKKQTMRPGRKNREATLIKRTIEKLYPDGIPDDVYNKTVVAEAKEQLKRDKKKVPSDGTFNTVIAKIRL